ncbi:MAG: DUF21 domain-containing protein, partial [Clostridiales bacterium]|nr:DUF21 domain-containing protein [Clostridiales bacterium]
MDTHLVRIITLVILVLLSAFFSSAETAYMTINRVRIKALADDGNKKAGRILTIYDDPQKMLSAILIGNNIVNLSASALMTVFVTDMWGNLYIGLGTGALTLVVLIFGEIIPKTIAKAYAESMALFYEPCIELVMILMVPFSFIINGIATALLKIFRIDTNKQQKVTENELKTYVDVSHEDGVIESDEKKMIFNLFDFSDALAKDIMIPRIDMSCVSSDADYNEVMRVFKEDAALHLTDGVHLYTLPLDAITELRLVEHPIRLIDWNKSEPPKSRRFLNAGVTTKSGEITGLRYCCALEFSDGGEAWSLLFPAYELPVFEQLTNLHAPQLPAVTAEELHQDD